MSSALAQRWRRRRYDLSILGQQLRQPHNATSYETRILNKAEAKTSIPHTLDLSVPTKGGNIFDYVSKYLPLRRQSVSAVKIVRTYVTAVQGRIKTCSEGELSSRLNSALTWNEKRKFYLTNKSFWVAFGKGKRALNLLQPTVNSYSKNFGSQDKQRSNVRSNIWLVFVTQTECIYCAVRTGS
jgi:hypothetical protein